MGYHELVVTGFDLYLGPSEFHFLPEELLSWSPGVKGNSEGKVDPRTAYEDPEVE